VSTDGGSDEEWSDDDEDEDEDDENGSVQSFESAETIQDILLRDRNMPPLRKYIFLCNEKIGSVHSGGLNFHVTFSRRCGICLLSDRANHKFPSLQAYLQKGRSSLDHDGHKSLHDTMMYSAQELKGFLMLAGALHQPFPKSKSNPNPHQKRNAAIYKLKAVFFEVRNLLRNLVQSFRAGKGTEKNSTRWEFIYCLQSPEPPAPAKFSPDFHTQLYALVNEDIALYAQQFDTIFGSPLCAMLEVDLSQAQPNTRSYQLFPPETQIDFNIPRLMYRVDPETRASAIFASEVLSYLFSGRTGGTISNLVKEGGFTIFDEEIFRTGSPFLPAIERDKLLGVNFPLTVNHQKCMLPKELEEYETMTVALSPAALGHLKSEVTFPHIFTQWMIYFNCLLVSSYQEADRRQPNVGESDPDQDNGLVATLIGMFQSAEAIHIAALPQEKAITLCQYIAEGLVKAYYQLMTVALQKKSRLIRNAEHTEFLTNLPRTDTQLENYKLQHGGDFLNFKKSRHGVSSCGTTGKNTIGIPCSISYV
jgi:hypothetical protein